MHYRHEWKHEISHGDLLLLRSRLGAVLQRDVHAPDGVYQVRSLYFDTPGDKALLEKIDGVNRREKFRIRLYNGDASFLMLEKKSKINSLCAKESCRITQEEAQRLITGDFGWMRQSAEPLCRELYGKMLLQGLRPKTIVEYTREPFVYAPGNVRVTLDHHIRTGLFRTNLFDPQTLTLPAGDPAIILEVKWDAFLPDIVKDAVAVPGRRVSAFSKYRQCRIYG